MESKENDGERLLEGEKLNTKAVAELLGVTTGAISRWRAKPDNNALPFHKLDGKYVYLRSDVDAWLASNENKGLDPKPKRGAVALRRDAPRTSNALYHTKTLEVRAREGEFVNAMSAHFPNGPLVLFDKAVFEKLFEKGKMKEQEFDDKIEVERALQHLREAVVSLLSELRIGPKDLHYMKEGRCPDHLDAGRPACKIQISKDTARLLWGELIREGGLEYNDDERDESWRLIIAAYNEGEEEEDDDADEDEDPTLSRRRDRRDRRPRYRR